MAQTTSKRTAKKKGGSAKKSGAAKRTATRSAKKPRARPQAEKLPERAEAAANAAAAGKAAVAGTKAAGRAVAVVAERGKKPLIVGGAAMAGVLAGLIALRRNGGSNHLGSGRWIPMRDGRLDLDAIAEAAKTAGSFGQQLSDIGTAIETVQRRKS